MVPYLSAAEKPPRNLAFFFLVRSPFPFPAPSTAHPPPRLLLAMFAARALSAAATGAAAPGQAAHGRSDFAPGQRQAAFSKGAFQRYLALFPQSAKVPIGVASLCVAGVGLFFAAKPRQSNNNRRADDDDGTTEGRRARARLFVERAPFRSPARRRCGSAVSDTLLDRACTNRLHAWLHFEGGRV